MSENTVFLSKAIKLRKVQLNLENTHEATLEKIIQCTDQSLRTFVDSLNLEREVTSDKVQQRVLNLQKPLQDICSKIKDANTIDLERFKEEMIALQENIKDTKQYIQDELSCLVEQEEVLMEDIAEFNLQISEWEKKYDYEVHLDAFPQRNLKRPSKSTLCKEVEEFSNFINASNGPYNGWSSEDHLIFCKIRNKYIDPERVAEKMNEILPDISFEKILSHYNWFDQYTTLRDRQETAIRNWRHDKMAKDNENSNTANRIDKMKKKSKKNSTEHEKLKKKLAEWKQEQMEKKLYQGHLELLNQKKKKVDDMMWRMRNEKIKEVVQKWKDEKTSIAKIMEQKKIDDKIRSQQARAAKAAYLIPAYQAQDKQHVDKKIKAVQKQRSNDASVKTSYASTAPRDPERLLNPTKQWISRTKRNSGSSSRDSAACNLNQVKKLGVPSWRKGLVI